jgi:hypothetical protein
VVRARFSRGLEDLGRAVGAIRKGPQPLSDAQWLLWLLAWRVSLGMAKRAVSLPRLVRAVRVTAGDSPRRAAEEIRTDLVGEWYRSESPLLPGNCLERSLLVHATWASVQRPTQLQVGFRRDRATTQGHTWVTSNGAPVLEPADAVRGFEVACAFDDTGTRHVAHTPA